MSEAEIMFNVMIGMAFLTSALNYWFIGKSRYSIYTVATMHGCFIYTEGFLAIEGYSAMWAYVALNVWALWNLWRLASAALRDGTSLWSMPLRSLNPAGSHREYDTNSSSP